jgi:large subunit ribosomal protein L4
MAEAATKPETSTKAAAGALKAPILGKQAKADLPKEIFSEPFHESLVHEAARADLAARRRGTHSSLTRGEVAMTTAKAWRQKGTGRARAGALSVPHRYGGGAAFGPKPRHYTVKVNRKARRRALRSALTVHAERGTIGVLDGSTFGEPATKQAAEALRKWGADAPILVVVTGDEDAAAKSFRNIEGATVALSGAAGVADVIGASSLLVSQAALDELASRASERPSADAKPRAERGEVSGEGRAG